MRHTCAEVCKNKTDKKTPSFFKKGAYECSVRILGHKIWKNKTEQKRKDYNMSSVIDKGPHNQINERLLKGSSST
jgi:hypothetical protein